MKAKTRNVIIGTAIGLAMAAIPITFAVAQRSQDNKQECIETVQEDDGFTFGAKLLKCVMNRTKKAEVKTTENERTETEQNTVNE